MGTWRRIVLLQGGSLLFSQKQTSDFTHGSILSRILQISLPMTLALLINVLYNVVDRMYIGHIAGDGKLALTGVGLAFPITVMVSAFQNLCSSGGSPVFSIARGRGEREKAELALGNTYAMLLALGIVLTVVGYAVKEPVLWLIGANEETFHYANDYLNIYLLGTVFVLTSMGMNPFINAQGASRVGMLTVLLGAVINILLDPVLIFGLGMGVQGAALASILAQAGSCVWTHAYLLGRKAEYRIRLKSMMPEWGLMGRILSLGTTGFIAQVTNSAVTMIYNAELAAMGGTVWVTTMTVVSSVREIMMMPMHGFTSGAQPVLGFNYGARRNDRVREGIRILTWISLAYQMAIWALLMLFPGVFIRLFNNDPELLELGSMGIRLFFCLTMFFALQTVGQTVFVALGRTRQAVFFSLLRKAFLVIPLALILPGMFGLGVKGVFLSEPISDILGGGACYLVMLRMVYFRLKDESHAIHP